MDGLTSLEICAGAGGQALGLEQAGFAHEAVVELDPDACETLRLNRGAAWKIIEGDIHDQDGRGFSGIDLLAGGIPCPPFSIAGKQLGAGDDRDLFPSALRLVREARPRAVLLENVRGLAARRFDGYRMQVLTCLRVLGYQTWWRQIQASEHEVPQLRPRFVLVAIRRPWSARFSWPPPRPGARPRSATRFATSWRRAAGPGRTPGPRVRAASRPPSSAEARNTAAPTWVPPGPARPGRRSAWTVSAWPTTPPARTSRPASRPS